MLKRKFEKFGYSSPKIVPGCGLTKRGASVSADT